MNLKFGLYVRKSSEDSSKQVQSIENQIEVLQKLAQRQGLNIVKSYQESKSAKIPYKREQFQQMIIDLQDGVIDAILCWKLDRLSRNPIDGGTIHHYLLQSTIKEIVTHERTYYPSDNSIMMSVELGMATEYSQALSKNVKRGQAFKTKKGSYPNKAPLGYINTIERIKGEKEVIPDPERFHLVRKLWDLLLTGNYSILQLIKKSKELGLKSPATRNKTAKPVSRNGLYKLFRNTFYYGEFKWSDELHIGNHEPMITRQEFEKAQEIIAGRNRPKIKKHDFAFTNLLTCGECGATITAEHKNKTRADGSVNHRSYYRCTHRKSHIACTQVGVRSENLEAQFAQMLDSITIPEHYIEWVKKWLKHANSEFQVKEQSVFKQQASAIEKINKQLEKLVDMKLEDIIDSETFKLKRDALISEKRLIEDDMSMRTSSQEYNSQKIVDVFEFCKNIKDLFESGDTKQKKLVLKAIGSRFYLKDKKLTVELASPFKLIQNAKADGWILNPRFATLETRINKGQTAAERTLIKNGGGAGVLPPRSTRLQR